MNVAVSWSGGKDSMLACCRAIRDGHTVTRLLNMVSKEYDRCCFHGIESRLMRDQAEAIGIPVLQRAMTDDMGEYEKEFRAALAELKASGVEGVVFGDIYLDEHKQWVERVCGDSGMTALEPLWNMDTAQLIGEFEDLGFRAVIVSCKVEMGRRFIGRGIRRDLADDMRKLGMCPCGENGEYHTLVTDGPLFSRRITITGSEAILREGFWKHWFMDIKNYTMEQKSRQPQPA